MPRSRASHQDPLRTALADLATALTRLTTPAYRPRPHGELDRSEFEFGELGITIARLGGVWWMPAEEQWVRWVSLRGRHYDDVLEGLDDIADALYRAGVQGVDPWPFGHRAIRSSYGSEGIALLHQDGDSQSWYIVWNPDSRTWDTVPATWVDEGFLTVRY